MRTTDKMTTDHLLTEEHGWTLVDWDTAYEAACRSVLAKMLTDVDPNDDWLASQIAKSVNDAVTDAWNEGMTHDEWVSRSLGVLYASGWNIGDRVEGGDNAEDYDTGRVLAVSDGDVTVGWDSGVRTTQPSDLLRPEGTKVYR